MKKLFIVIGIFTSFSLYSMNYRLAQTPDLDGIVSLQETALTNGDGDKIVILPKVFRNPATLQTIKKGRIFVAQEQETGKILGCKKLFIMNNKKEKESILKDEIRCFDNSCNVASIDPDTFEIVKHFDKKPLCYQPKQQDFIYNGGDFTNPDSRGKGINTALTNFALTKQINNISISCKNKQAVCMVYGLTKANAGTGLLGGRTKSIIKSFTTFAKQLPNCDTSTITVQRHHAFMPTFNPESETCKPLPDKHSIPGFGYVLTYKLNEK